MLSPNKHKNKKTEAQQAEQFGPGDYFGPTSCINFISRNIKNMHTLQAHK